MVLGIQSIACIVIQKMMAFITQGRLVFVKKMRL